MSKKNSEYLINRKDNQYEVVIGLEVHAQVLSESKLFSTSATKFGAEPNTQVSLVDAAFPGMLPVINEFCVKQAIKTGIGLNAKINKRSVFDRKNYFYADLPQGYQISQFKDPSCMFPSHVPKYLIIDLNFLIYAFTSSGDLKSGLLTISIKATPDLFKSTKVFLGSRS